MIHVKVQYDSEQRTFKLVDEEFGVLLDGDGLYDLAIPVMFEEADIESMVSLDNVAIAHA